MRQVQQLGKDAVGEPCIPDVLPCPITDSPLHTIAGHYRFMNAREALVQLNGLPPNTTVPCLTSGWSASTTGCCMSEMTRCVAEGL